MAMRSSAGRRRRSVVLERGRSGSSGSPPEVYRHRRPHTWQTRPIWAFLLIGRQHKHAFCITAVGALPYRDEGVSICL